MRLGRACNGLGSDLDTDPSRNLMACRVKAKREIPGKEALGDVSSHAVRGGTSHGLSWLAHGLALIILQARRRRCNTPS